MQPSPPPRVGASMTDAALSPIVAEGRNCWRIERAEMVGGDQVAADLLAQFTRQGGDVAFAGLPLAAGQHEGGCAALADGQDAAADVTNDPGDDLYSFHAPSIFAARGAK